MAIQQQSASDDDDDFIFNVNNEGFGEVIEEESDIVETVEVLYPIDVVIPTAAKDFGTLYDCIVSIFQNVIGVRRVIVLSPDRPPPFFKDLLKLYSDDINNKVSKGSSGVSLRWVGEWELQPSIDRDEVEALLKHQPDSTSNELESTEVTAATPATKPRTRSTQTVNEEALFKSRLGWYIQQVLKLRVFELLGCFGIEDRCLLVDADMVFHREVHMVDQTDGCSLFATLPDYHHKPYFDHIDRISKGTIQKQFSSQSAICHHMLLEKHILNALETHLKDIWESSCTSLLTSKQLDDQHSINMASSSSSSSSSSSTSLSLWRLFLSEVDPKEITSSGASEFELYFNFALQYCPTKCRLRKLHWRNVLGRVIRKRSDQEIRSTIALNGSGASGDGDNVSPYVALDSFLELWLSTSPEIEQASVVATLVGGRDDILKTSSITSSSTSCSTLSKYSQFDYDFSAFHNRDLLIQIPLAVQLKKLSEDFGFCARQVLSKSKPELISLMLNLMAENDRFKIIMMMGTTPVMPLDTDNASDGQFNKRRQFQESSVVATYVEKLWSLAELAIFNKPPPISSSCSDKSVDGVIKKASHYSVLNAIYSSFVDNEDQVELIVEKMGYDLNRDRFLLLLEDLMKNIGNI